MRKRRTQQRAHVGASGTTASPRDRTRRRSAPGPQDRRERILKTALAEFATRGYDATGMDRLARRAGVNKALIYYYFGSKLGLYQSLLRDLVAELHARLSAVATGPGTASDKLDRYVATLVGHFDRRTEVPPIMLREIADGGRRLDPDTLRLLLSLLPLLQRVLVQGQREGLFGRSDPVLTHFVLMGATMLFTGNAPIRRRVRQLGLAQPPLEAAPFIDHVQTVLRRTLRKDAADVASA